MSEIQAYFGMSPNAVVVRGRDQHVQLSSRQRQVLDWNIGQAIELAGICADLNRGETVRLVRLRRVYFDNKHGTLSAKIHVLHDHNDWPGPRGYRERIEALLGEGWIVDLDVRHRRVFFDCSHFVPNAEEFYEDSEFGDHADLPLTELISLARDQGDTVVGSLLGPEERREP